MRRMVRTSSGWKGFAVIAMALVPFPVLAAEQPPRDFWDTLRENGGALIEDLRARAKPRGQPETWTAPRPVQAPEPEIKATPIDRWLPASLDAPRFSRILVKAGEPAVIEGRGTPGSRIELRRDDRTLATAAVTGDGMWRAVLSGSLAPGTHRIESFVSSAGNRERLAGSDVRIAIPERWSGEILVSYTGEGDPADPARAAAEALAHEASARFTQIVPAKPEQPVSVPRAPPREARAAPQEAPDNPVVRWLERSARTYQDTVIADLARPAPDRASAEEGGHVETGGLGERVARWFDRSRRTYEVEVAERLSAAGPTSAAPDRAAEPPQEPAQPGDRWQVDTELAERQAADRAAEEARLRRDRENQERIRAAERRQREEEARLLAVERSKREKEAAARREAEARKLAEIERSKAEARRLAELARRERIETARREAESKNTANSKLKDAERQKRRQEEAERARLAREEAKEQRRLKAAEAKAKAEEKRLADERRKAEARAAAEEARRKDAERAEDRKREKETVPAQPQPAVPPAEVERIVREEQRAMEEEDVAMRLAADVQRRAEAAAEQPPPRRSRDLRPAEGSAEGDDEDPPVAKRACLQTRGRRVRGGRMHVVRPGDTLWGLSQRYYGSGRRYMILYRANKARVSSPDLIVDCQRLFIPMRRR